MIYVPIIKLKKYEILRAKYVVKYINHQSIIPFLELRYSLSEEKKNSNLKDFIEVTHLKKYFLGIPHKKTAIKVGDNDGKDNFVVDANKNIQTYFNESLSLFDDKNAIPVFYVYKEEDKEYIGDFIEYGHSYNRTIGIITTPKIASELKDVDLSMSDYLLIDLGNEKINSQRLNLEKASRNTKCRIILIRENRGVNTNNTSIELDEEAPLLSDLSTEFDDAKKIRMVAVGFGDYCGQKNNITTTGGNGKVEQYPATSIYMKEKSPCYFHGLKSELDTKSGGFDDLKKLVLERINKLDPNNVTPLEEMLNSEGVGYYAMWHIIEEWCYIAKMSYYDDWKNEIIKGF